MGIRTAKKADALGRDAWYPALHLMTAREKAGTVDGFYLAVQAASNGRSHGHDDSGSFIVFHDGEPVIIGHRGRGIHREDLQPGALHHLDNAVGLSQPADNWRM